MTEHEIRQEREKMKEPFADYETSEMLKELGFDEKVIGYHLNKVDGVYITAYERVEQHRSIKAPLWQQVEEWLWEKHKIYFKLLTGFFGFQYTSHMNEEDFIKSTISASPITAKIEGIKQAVKHLHSKK